MYRFACNSGLTLFTTIFLPQNFRTDFFLSICFDSIPEFLTGARYEASDSLSPRWSAAYDIESCSLFSDPKYTKLRANRSPREGELVQRLGVLDRRTCETLNQTSQPIKEVREVAKFVVTIAGDEEIREQELESLKTVQGWKRSSSHKVYDSLIIGYGKEPKSNVAPKFVVVHGEPFSSSLVPNADTEESLSRLVSGQNSIRKPMSTLPSTRKLF